MVPKVSLTMVFLVSAGVAWATDGAPEHGTSHTDPFADVALAPHARVIFRDSPSDLAEVERELGAWIESQESFGVVTIYVASGRVS